MRLRFSLSFLALVLSGSFALAQDAGMQAAQMAEQVNQQAMQDAQMANQMAMQASQQASQDAQQAAQQAMQNSNSGAYGMPMAAAPKLSVKSGTYPGTITVRMKDKTRGAIMYYTTDGWTPTAQSTRYLGPIQITSTTHLQVIAIAPYYLRSQIATASYVLPGTTPVPASSPVATNAVVPAEPSTKALAGKLVLPKGAEVPLVVTADVTSRKLEIGDTVPMALAQDLTVDGVVVAKKGTPATATVIQVDGAAIVGQPGTITFAVHALDLPGNAIPLDGTKTKEGEDKYKTVRTVAFVPFVGISALFVHGKQAEIAPNTTLTAQVEQDTPVQPAE